MIIANTAARIHTELENIPIHILPTLLGIAIDKREKMAAPQEKPSHVVAFKLEMNFHGPNPQVIDVPIYNTEDRVSEEAESPPGAIS